MSLTPVFISSISGNYAVVDQSGNLSVNTSVSISGQPIVVASGLGVVIASGIIPNISGQAVSVSVSGNVVILSGVIPVNNVSGVISVQSGSLSVASGAISVVSGSITINSGQVAVSGLYTTATIQSGAGGISGIGAQALFAYDASGQVWNPVGTSVSGARTLTTTIMGVGNVTPCFCGALTTDNNPAPSQVALNTMAVNIGFDPSAPGANAALARVRMTASGDHRLRVSTEGRAPTYTVNTWNTAPISGAAAASRVAPIICLFNYGSGTAIQSGACYKIKSLFISPDPANVVASGLPIKFDIMRFTGFSGGGTLLSGVAHDTADPAYSGTLAAPALMAQAASGIVLDAVFFSYITSTEGPYVNAANIAGIENSIFEPSVMQNTNLIQSRMWDTKEIVIRSGYGFAVIQSSGYGYTQLLTSGMGTYNFSLTYSVEGQG